MAAAEWERHNFAVALIRCSNYRVYTVHTVDERRSDQCGMVSLFGVRFAFMHAFGMCVCAMAFSLRASIS